VQQSQHLVFAVALSRLRDVEEAKDAVQDAFAKAWRRLDQLRDPAAFSPWLNSIVLSECSRRRRQRMHLREEHANDLRTIESQTDRVDYRSVVAIAIDMLSDAERDVIVLYYYLGYSLPQIARRQTITHCSPPHSSHAPALGARRLRSYHTIR
jgi:RNA polymerase sigma-70 factor (ECF subfamily)